ncbi:hypothetical protein [Niallia circulans]|uniref:Uncharacterized protein n=1 Tax=Niallia circulans TaxID=1397 RepID=A0A941GAH6_NIACI|nr:hypothetical protein [Niallia circulans]MCB5235519.1 hypothetical protein [Niallia circulans]
MDKKEIINIFNELLAKWRVAEETVIDNIGDLDHSGLEQAIKEYKIRFQEALDS